jgi:Fur family ferric uptake transcriptional regulator
MTLKRKTKQKDAIRKVLEDSTRAFTVPEIHEEAMSDVPNIGIATVYRQVGIMADEGMLKVVKLPGDPLRFEWADKKDHHHFKCNDCGKVYDVDCKPGVYDDILPKSFKLRSHDLFMYGNCGCQ